LFSLFRFDHDKLWRQFWKIAYTACSSRPHWSRVHRHVMPMNKAWMRIRIGPKR
jgi:hypothetical protein